MNNRNCSRFTVYRLPFPDGTPVFRPASFAHAGLKTGVPSGSELHPNAIISDGCKYSGLERDAWCVARGAIQFVRDRFFAPHITYHAPRTTAQSMEIGFWRKKAYSRSLS
jgi:hypothetical protein